jgi:carboxymethylenebutenolidase
MGETGSERIKIESGDGFSFSALFWRPPGPPAGAVVVIQEIFGLSAHVAEMGARFQREGFAVIAPSMFDRIRPDFAVEPERLSEMLPIARDMAARNGDDNALADIAACRDRLEAFGPVFLTGYCYGGSMSWLAAQRLDGFAAASCYYGSRAPVLAEPAPRCPAICHFGRHDPHIPMSAVEALAAARPETAIHVYDAGHGFARRLSADYDGDADALAFQRTLDLFGRSLRD